MDCEMARTEQGASSRNYLNSWTNILACYLLGQYLPQVYRFNALSYRISAPDVESFQVVCHLEMTTIP